MVASWWLWSVCLGTKMSCMLTRQSPEHRAPACVCSWRISESAGQRCCWRAALWNFTAEPLLSLCAPCALEVCSESTLLGVSCCSRGKHPKRCLSKQVCAPFCSGLGLLCQPARAHPQLEGYKQHKQEENTQFCHTLRTLAPMTQCSAVWFVLSIGCINCCNTLNLWPTASLTTVLIWLCKALEYKH